MAQNERNRSPTPTSQPLSKGDRRRKMLQDRLAEMVSNFSKDRDQHYRAQLQALQVDMNLILKADAYVDAPLDDDPDTIQNLIREALGNTAPHQALAASADFSAMAGRGYLAFVEKVNQAQEERDAALTMLWDRRQRIEDEAHYTSHYKRFLAKEEQQQLKSTIRERHIAVLSQKRAKMIRDKEQLDIADSNALLLNPNQFSITNPSSPGGPQNPRKTRHTRHQRGDPDDTVETGTKRKRRAYHDDYENGSPAPATRNIDYGVSSPFRDNRSRLLHSQFEAPLYSIERLFSEKELSMATNAAHIATSHHFAQLRVQDTNTNQTTTAEQTNDNEDIDAPCRPDLTHDGAADDETNPPLSAPEMDRSASTQTHYHATRSTRNINALNDFAAIASGERSLPIPSSRPILLPTSKANATAPPPPALAPAEVDSDLAIMGLADSDTPRPPVAENLNDILLDRVCAPPRHQFLTKRVPGLTMPNGNDPVESNLRGLPGIGGGSGSGVVAPLGGVPMSAQSSMAGQSDAPGGVPMSRIEGSSRGGYAMNRTASGAGSAAAAADFVKRMKGRVP
ncbi:MAG: hypothetical protein M1820_009664 [Bogoriella megaspora]|nr:MAG: hypothetical protein M1820_009664 [Bogoriella megaspora]